MGRIDLLRFDSGIDLAQCASTRWLEHIRTSAEAGRSLSVAVSGGRIARQFFEATAKASRECGLKLDNVEFFWADERCVPPEDPESNFLLAQTHLLSPLGIRGERVHRIRGELMPSSAASEAAVDLAQRVSADAVGLPALDLVFLGMGEDGHVASLFPGEPDAVVDSPSLFRVVIGPKPPPRRITMSLGLLAAAREAWVLASGPRKENALRDALSGRGRTPVVRLTQARPLTRIFTDIGGK